MFLCRAATLTLCRSRRLLSTKNIAPDFAALITELNQEMESIFGDILPSGLASSTSSDYTSVQSEPRAGSHALANSIGDNSMAQKGDRLSHVGNAGEAQMVDVSPKQDTKRTAVASCKVILGRKVFDMVLANQMAKGDVLTVAKLAGINGAKHTSGLIPLCHNIALTYVRVDLRLDPDDFSVRIEGEAATTGKTGVEMEAMTAVSIAGLTVYDMCKAASKDIRIEDVRLISKTGGKSGNWYREE